MKNTKVFGFLSLGMLLAVSLTLSSCGGAKTQNSGSTEPEKANTESSASLAEESAYTDLKFFQLRGPVKNLKVGDFEESDNYTFYEFTGDGRLYTVDGDKTMFTRKQAERVYIEEEDTFADLPIYKRDNDGNISEIEFMESAQEYKWENGRVASYKWFCEGTEGQITYTYDSNGDVIKLTEVCGSEGEELSEESSVEYKIIKRDSHGNWIEREVICEDPYTEKRAIEYYE